MKAEEVKENIHAAFGQMLRGGEEEQRRGAYRIAHCQQGALAVREIQLRADRGEQGWQGKPAGSHRSGIQLMCKA